MGLLPEVWLATQQQNTRDLHIPNPAIIMDKNGVGQIWSPAPSPAFVAPVDFECKNTRKSWLIRPSRAGETAYDLTRLFITASSALWCNTNRRLVAIFLLPTREPRYSGSPYTTKVIVEPNHRQLLPF